MGAKQYKIKGAEQRSMDNHMVGQQDTFSHTYPKTFLLRNIFQGCTLRLPHTQQDTTW